MRGENQGQELALNWNNTAQLKNFTSLIGTDGVNFLPVNDRGHYSAGVIRQLPTGGIFYSGLPVVQMQHPWLSDGQLETLLTYLGNCTLKHHIPQSVGRLDIQTSNVVFNPDLNQLASLQRKRNGYVGFLSTFVIVEVL